jgi:hypothetical protein
MSNLLKFNTTIACILGCAAQYSYAAPVVTGTNGALDQGATISILGSGFGTRPQPVPFYSDDYEGYAVGQSALQAGLDDLGNDEQGLPYVRDDRALSGSKSLRMDYLSNKDSMFPRIGQSGLTSTSVYISAWMYWTRTAGSGSGAFIFKLVRGGANPPYSGVPRFYETIFPEPNGIVTAADRGSVNSAGSTTWTQDLYGLQNRDGWHRVEYYFQLSTPGVADGVFQSWVDGIRNVNLLKDRNRLAGNSSLINYVMSPFDGNDSYGLSNSYRIWVDNFYIDTTRARVEIGNASTLAASTIRYIQPTTQWSGGSISVKLDLNTFTAGQKVYLYVFDSSGTANSQGYPLTVGATDQTSRPLPPTVTVQ